MGLALDHKILCSSGGYSMISLIVSFLITNINNKIKESVLVLIERKIQFTQGNSKIAVVLSDAHRIFKHAHSRNYTHACISYRNAYPINTRSSIFRNF